MDWSAGRSATTRRDYYPLPSDSSPCAGTLQRALVDVHRPRSLSTNKQNIYDAQKAYFRTGVTRSYEWRVEQLDRMARLLSENERALQKAVAADFKTASQEFVFETAAPLGETQFQKSKLKAWMGGGVLPKFLVETGHKGFVYRDPYGVTLIMRPFNGSLTLLIRSALTALAAGNTCILKLSERLGATSAAPRSARSS